MLMIPVSEVLEVAGFEAPVEVPEGVPVEAPVEVSVAVPCVVLAGSVEVSLLGGAVGMPVGTVVGLHLSAGIVNCFGVYTTHYHARTVNAQVRMIW
jgi:hypothetical protein